MTDQPDMATPEADAPKKGSILKETAIILISALILSWVIKTFLVQAFYIPSGSMENTLQEDDRILVTKMVPELFEINRGDIVVFKDPAQWLGEAVTYQDSGAQAALRKGLTFIGILPQDAGSHLIKRVIGMPGDEIECCGEDGKLTVNGQPIDESVYLKEGEVPSLEEFHVIVPDGNLWVMGDNRSGSADSRAHIGGPGGGFVPIENVVGTSFVKIWPLDRAGWLKNPGEVFEDVPQP